MKLPAVAAYKAESIRVVPTAVLGESKCRDPERRPKYKGISCPVISSSIRLGASSAPHLKHCYRHWTCHV